MILDLSRNSVGSLQLGYSTLQELYLSYDENESGVNVGCATLHTVDVSGSIPHVPSILKDHPSLVCLFL